MLKTLHNLTHGKKQYKQRQINEKISKHRGVKIVTEEEMVICYDSFLLAELAELGIYWGLFYYPLHSIIL